MEDIEKRFSMDRWRKETGICVKEWLGYIKSIFPEYKRGDLFNKTDIEYTEKEIIIKVKK